MFRSNSPSAWTSCGISDLGRTGRPSTRTRCRPTRNVGRRRARSTASAAARPATIRLALDKIPFLCASSTASLMAMSRPKSSAQTISFFTARRRRLRPRTTGLWPAWRAGRPQSQRLARELAAAQELEELDALAQAAAHHFRALDHLGDQGGDLAAPEIEALVKGLERLEDLGVRQVRIVQRRDLHATLVDEFGVAEVEPAVFDRLAVQIGARIGCGERDLDRVRVDFRGKADGFFDRLLGLTGKAEDEGAVDRDPELVAILGKASRDVDPHPLLDVVENLLIAGFIADKKQPQPVVAQHFQRCAWHVGLGIAGPGYAELAEFSGDRLG